MGLIMSILENGFYADPISYAAEKGAEQIYKGIKCAVTDDDEEDIDEVEDEDTSPIMTTIRKKGSFDTERKTRHCNTEVIKGKFDQYDILRNIAAAVNQFGISDSEDMRIARTQISAILYMSGLSDTDTIFEALNKDAVSYAAVNELVRMYSGEAMDKKIIPVDIEKDIDNAANEKLKMIADWELEYLSDRIHMQPNVCQLVHTLFAEIISSC